MFSTCNCVLLSSHVRCCLLPAPCAMSMSVCTMHNAQCTTCWCWCWCWRHAICHICQTDVSRRHATLCVCATATNSHGAYATCRMPQCSNVPSSERMWQNPKHGRTPRPYDYSNFVHFRRHCRRPRFLTAIPAPLMQEVLTRRAGAAQQFLPHPATASSCLYAARGP